MADAKSKGELVRVKVDPTGLDVAVSEGLPDLFRRVLPVRWAGRRDAERAVIEQVIERIKNDSGFGLMELEFIEEMLGEQVGKYLRLKQIHVRAAEIVRSLPASTSEVGEAKQPRTTSDDWVNKFREDASLVDDDVLREAYARILATESGSPGAVSLRTLGVLRYLDRDVADAFGKLLGVLIDGSLIPLQGGPEEPLGKIGLHHIAMLAMEDAGLVSASAQSMVTKKQTQVPFVLTGHRKVVAFEHPDGHELSITLQVHVLTPAGVQLARVAEALSDDGTLTAMLQWMHRAASGATMRTADLPAQDWDGPLETLGWAEWRPSSST